MKKFLAILLLMFLGGQAFAYQLFTPAGTVDVVSANIEGNKATYVAVVADFVPVTTATDMLQLRASSTKKVKLSRVCVSGDATGNSTQDVYLYKRTASNTGGTSAPVTIAKHDTDDPAPTASVVSYSVNPTGLGAGVLIGADHVAFPASSNPTVAVGCVRWFFGNRASKAPMLKAGSNEAFSISWNGNAVPAGASVYMTIEWTEE